jgi:glycosyltransferase involved in cell wall biosynthesis
VTAGFFSPFPPARTGVADYAASLLPALRQFGSVEVDAPDAPVNLYHLGNNLFHREIYARALARPGVAVLHDAVLHHFFLGSLDEERYIDEFVYNYGEWNHGLARELWLGRPRSALDPRYFRYAMVRRIAETSLAIVVHNPGAAAIVKSHAPEARVVEIPHLFSPPSDFGNARHELGIGPRTFLFSVFGHLRETKRLFSVLHAFEKVRSAGSDAALLVAGDFASPELERAIAPLVEAPGVLRRGYAEEPQFWRLAAATDACVNLRYPAAGETSGIAIRLMGIGKPVLMTAGAEASGFPEDACLRVDSGAAEAAMLAEFMTWLAANPEHGVEIGRRAQRHIRSEHALEQVAARYWHVLEDAA